MRNCRRTCLVKVVVGMHVPDLVSVNVELEDGRHVAAVVVIATDLIPKHVPDQRILVEQRTLTTTAQHSACSHSK